MSLTIPEKQTFETAPAGTFIGTCFQVIDLGSQISEYNGEKKVHKKVRLAWELSDAPRMKDGRLFSVNKSYNLSSNEKSSLVTDINSWRGKPFSSEEFGSFDLAKLLGKSCMMQVVQKESKGKMYANVGTIMALPKSTASATLENPAVKFDISNFDQAVFDGLSEYLRTMISSSPEYRQLNTSADDGQNDASDEMPNQDIPF